MTADRAVTRSDRPDAEPMRVPDEVLELLMDLEATPEQFNCPFLYTSRRLALPVGAR